MSVEDYWSYWRLVNDAEVNLFRLQFLQESMVGTASTDDALCISHCYQSSVSIRGIELELNYLEDILVALKVFH